MNATMMNASFLERHGDIDVIKIGHLPVPTIRPTEILVELKFAALNHLDIWVRKGLPNLRLEFPHVLGGDGAGHVSQVGSTIKHLKEGDEVIVHPGLSCLRCEKCLLGFESQCKEYGILGEHVSGTHAKYVKVPASNVFIKPKNLSFEEASGLGLIYTTAYHMVKRRAKISAGDIVLIHGAGSGVSLALLELCLISGAEVIMTSTSQEKLERVKKLGCHHTLCSTQNDFVEGVKTITSSNGVDVVFDHVGENYWESNLKCLKWGGKFVTCGATSGKMAKLDLTHLFYKQWNLMGSTMGSKGDFGRILELFSKGKLKVAIDSVFPFSEIRNAHQKLERGEQFGKVLCQIC